MNIGHSILVGVIQGICDFLPLSSKAHQIIIPLLTSTKKTDELLLSFAQFGTLFALIVYFLKEWILIIRGGFLSIIERHIGLDEYRKEFWIIIISSIPLYFSFIFLEHVVENIGHLIIAIWLSAFGFLLYLFDTSSVISKNADEIKTFDLLLLALVNSLAIIPGIGTVTPIIITGRLLGFTRLACFRFSILLTLPVLILYSYRNIDTILYHPNILYKEMLITFFSAFVLGIFTIKLLQNYAKKRSYALWGWYRILLGVLILIVSLIFKI